MKCEFYHFAAKLFLATNSMCVADSSFSQLSTFDKTSNTLQISTENLTLDQIKSLFWHLPMHSAEVEKGPKKLNYELLFLHGFLSKYSEILHSAIPWTYCRLTFLYLGDGDQKNLLKVGRIFIQFVLAIVTVSYLSFFFITPLSA